MRRHKKDRLRDLLFLVFEHEQFRYEIVQDRCHRDQDQFHDTDIHMQDIDEDQNGYRLDSQREESGGCKLDQFIEEAVICPIEVEIAEQNERDQSRQDPGQCIGDSSVEMEGPVEQDRHQVVGYR